MYYTPANFCKKLARSPACVYHYYEVVMYTLLLTFCKSELECSTLLLLDKITVKSVGTEPNAVWAILKTLDYEGGIMVPFVTSLFLAQS